MARTKLESAEEAWGILAEKTYGALVTRVGKRKANRFFPRRRRDAGDELTESTPERVAPTG